jgi:hypothetical protein
VALEEFCSNNKTSRVLAVREAVIVVGRDRGIRNGELAKALGVDPSAVTRRIEAVRMRGEENEVARKLRMWLTKRERISQSQA